MLKAFIDSYSQGLPTVYRKLLNELSLHPNLIVHHPIQASINSSIKHPLNVKIKTLESAEVIPKGASVFMTSANCSFNNVDFVGATYLQKKRFQQIFKQSEKKYELLQNQQLAGLFQILTQIYANDEELDEGKQMPLKSVSQLIMNDSHVDSTNQNLLSNLGLKIDFEKYQNKINSVYLKSILNSNQKINETLFKILQQNFVKIANQKQFSNILKFVRAQTREVNQSSSLAGSYTLNKWSEGKIQTLSPLLSSIRLSHSPNCVIVGKYFTHLRQSFYCIQALRDIKGGEQLTISYKVGANNYQKMLKYGYKSIIEHPENPYNNYMLPMDLMNPQIEQVQQIMMGNINYKNTLLQEYDLKMRNLLRIINDGAIAKQDIRLFRILLGVQRKQQILANYLPIDKKVYDLANKFISANEGIHSKQREQLKKQQREDDPIVKSFRIIQKGQIQILDRFKEKYQQIKKIN